MASTIYSNTYSLQNSSRGISCRRSMEKKMLTMARMLTLTIDEVSSLASEICEDLKYLGYLGRD